MLTINKQTPAPNELVDWLSTVPGFIQGFTQVDDKPVQLYDYQISLVESSKRFRAVLKSRQTGLSFVMAAEALAKTHLRREHTSIYVSYNLDDAKEKIRHADMLYDSMPLAWKKKRITDNKTELEFEDSRGHRTRMISMPCREPRGKGKADVNLDELPFMRQARRIYTAAVPIISRGGGSLTLGSTPLGKSDIFYEILEGEADNYPQYERIRVAWWDCPEFCTDVGRARREAPSMSTAERVAEFGTESLSAIFHSLDLESFQQEYELVFVDDAVAFIPWELILAASRDGDELDVARSVTEFASAPTVGPLYAGYDVGRRRDAAELQVVEQVGEKRFRVRLMMTMDQTEFSQQRAELAILLNTRRDISRLCIDETGMGMDMAEFMVQSFPGRVEAISFTNAVKQDLANGLKIALQDRRLQIPADRGLMTQIHSVKKFVTVAGNIRLDTDGDEKHHADKFWALALAVHAGEDYSPVGVWSA